MLLHHEEKRSLCNQLRIIHHALWFRARQPVVSYTCTRTNYYHWQCIPIRLRISETGQGFTLRCQVAGHLQKHLPWVLNELLDLDQERHGFPTVK
jgi:hypothetical protein